MNTDKTSKTDRIAIRIDKQLKDKIQAICDNKNMSMSQLITSLLKEYIKEDYLNNNSLKIIKIPIDKISYARLNLYSLEHDVAINELMLGSALDTIKQSNVLK